MNSYGITQQTKLSDKFGINKEELSIQGYSVLPAVLNPEECARVAEKLHHIYDRQLGEIEGYTLEDIRDQYVARMPLAYDDYFVTLAGRSPVIDLIRSLMGDYFILHLQNGILNMPEKDHQQRNWHRDLPYQNYTSSRPLALNAMYCIDDFTADNGATWLIPHSHKMEAMPSDTYIRKHRQQVLAKAGDVLLMDSMIFHKAGENHTDQVRIGVNHVYATGMIRPQIDIPAMLQGKFQDDPFLRILLGYAADVPGSVKAWRDIRFSRK